MPADLRIDHVYLVSCKYLSRIVVNASPHHLFDRLLAGGHGRRGADWFGEVAPAQHAALYSAVRGALDLDLPGAVDALSTKQRQDLGHRLNAGWPDETVRLYESLVAHVADASAQRWRTAIGTDAESMLWRLLRIGSAPYFVLGSAPSGFLRLRIATPWDWRRHFELRTFDVDAARRRATDGVVDGNRPRAASRAPNAIVDGHVEIRWSHGRFAGRPEAKVYLDTPHAEIPGYFPLL